MNMDSRQHFTLPKSEEEEEEDCNATPGGVVISLAGSNVEYCNQSSYEICSEEEELINRLYNLVGDRWDLIAGRFPWRRKEEIENYCKMRYIVTTSSSRS